MAQKPIETITCFRFLPVYQESPINKQFPVFYGFPSLLFPCYQGRNGSLQNQAALRLSPVLFGFIRGFLVP